MCWLCTKHLSSEKVIEQLNFALDNVNKDPEYFNLWNTSSLSFLLYSTIGINGVNARDIGLKLLQKFNLWIKTKPAYYIPNSGVEPMLHHNVINKYYLWVCNFTNPKNLSKIKLLDLLNNRINQFVKEQTNYEFFIGLNVGFSLVVIGICIINKLVN